MKRLTNTMSLNQIQTIKINAIVVITSLTLLSGCGSPPQHQSRDSPPPNKVDLVDREWNRIAKTNNTYNIKSFINRHTHHPLADVARERLDELEWKEARQKNNTYAYGQYIKKHPQGQYIGQAQSQVAKIKEEQREKARRQAERKKQKKAAREAEEKAAREAFLKKIPESVADGAYVRAHREDDSKALKSIGLAGEFVLQRILKISKQRLGPHIEPQPQHPLIVEFREMRGKTDSIQGIVDETPVSGNIGLYGKYNGKVVDPATQAVRKKVKSNIGVPLFDPRLHITSGGFESWGTIVINDLSLRFLDGGVMTQSTSDRAFFMRGTRVSVGDKAYVFDGQSWTIVNK